MVDQNHKQKPEETEPYRFGFKAFELANEILKNKDMSMLRVNKICKSRYSNASDQELCKKGMFAKRNA